MTRRPLSPEDAAALLDAIPFDRDPLYVEEEPGRYDAECRWLVVTDPDGASANEFGQGATCAFIFVGLWLVVLVATGHLVFE